MGIQVEWLDEQQNIIHVKYSGRWTWDDWTPAFAQIKKMMDNAGHKVDFIVNVSRSLPPPSGALYRLNEFVETCSNNQGVVVFVGMSRFMKAIVKTFWFVFPEAASKYPFEFANTVAEAEAMLTRHHEEWA